MKTIITGMHGTVAPVLAHRLQDAGHQVVPWDRTLIPPDDFEAVRTFIQEELPDGIFHVAVGSPQWAEWIAEICAWQGIRFLFTSSVSVFAASQQGPFSVEREPRPEDDYGRYKLECEERVGAVNPEAQIVRLGWQIGTTPGGNHMVDHLYRTFQAQGVIEASTEWYPACSFLADSAASLVQLMVAHSPGLYHLDGNPGLNFYEIVTGLKNFLKAPWVVQESHVHVQNNRMVDPRVQVRLVTEWFNRGQLPVVRI